MMWEYKVETFEMWEDMEVALNELGQGGWEMVGFSGEPSYYVIVVKRPKVWEPGKSTN